MVSIAVRLKFASVAEEAASDNWCARPARIVVDSEWWVPNPSPLRLLRERRSGHMKPSGPRSLLYRGVLRPHRYVASREIF